MFVPTGTEELDARERFPIVTAALVSLNLVVFLIEFVIVLAQGQEGLYSFINDFGLVPVALTSGESSRIPFFLTPLTSMFVHAGPTHVGFNMIYLLAFGDNVEDRLGRWRYLLFYLLTGLLAGSAQVAVNPTSDIPGVGASGAIAGVLAAYVVLFPKGIVRMFLFLGPMTRIRRVPALAYIVIWFAMQFFNGVGSLGVETAETGGTAYWAHIGGFVAGLVLAVVYRYVRERPGLPPQSA